MDREEFVVVDVKEIMQTIRKEVEENGPYEEILAFSDIPLAQEIPVRSIPQLKEAIYEQTRDLEIPPIYAINDKNPFKKNYKRVASKAVRCATFPISVRTTETNTKIRDCINLLVQMIEQQQQEIDSLSEKVSRLERKIHGDN